MLNQSRQVTLLVDDDESTREMLRLLLRPFDLHLITAQTSSRALALIKSERFDLYILDVWLPFVNGFALCKAIRCVDRSARILFYSGAAMPEDIRRGYAAGADAYVVKPDITGLVSCVEQLLTKDSGAGVARSATRPEYFPMAAGS